MPCRSDFDLIIEGLIIDEYRYRYIEGYIYTNIDIGIYIYVDIGTYIDI